MSKRIFDIVFSLSALCLFAPLLLLISILVRRHLGTPVIYKQLRPGFKCNPFQIYKFRTMTDGRDETGNVLPDKKRLTPLGLFLRSASLDELPELWNVLIGDMSLVGPRPLLMEYLPLYNDTQKRRHEARPGITGWAQVNGRNAISWQKKFELDVWYVDNQSLWLDLKILFLTVWKVISRSDINQAGQATVEPFNGRN